MFVKSVMENESVQSLINENDKVIEDVINSTIQNIIKENINIVRENLDQFISEGDVLETYEDISIWSNEDIQEYMEAVSLVVSDKELTQEEKIEILNEVNKTGFFKGYKLARDGRGNQGGGKEGFRARMGRAAAKGVKALGKIGKKIMGAGRTARDFVMDKVKALKAGKKKPATAVA